VVVGHTNLDHFFRVRRLPGVDRTVPLLSRETRLGGTAANIARVAARLGVRVALHSHVGRDFPSAFRQRLVADGVDVSGLVVVPTASSPACYITEDARGGQTTLIDQGPMAHLPREVPPESLLRRAPWVHLATGDPAYQLRVLRVARRAGRRVAADPAQEIHYRWNRGELRELLAGAEIFFANRSEARRAAQLLHVASIRRLTEQTPLVIVTHGRRGATAYGRSILERVGGATAARNRQVTGAGDAFRGGFYAAWMNGEPLRDCLRRASYAAARWVENGDTLRLGRGARPVPRSAYMLES
jgi:sugar/nucleoside kinase (ribokinase family)